jgi:hypothetical protein
VQVIVVRVAVAVRGLREQQQHQMMATLVVLV